MWFSAAAGVCDVDGSGHVQKKLADVAPALEKGRFAKLWRGLRAVDPTDQLEVDERHLRFVVVGDKPPGVRLPLALPAPWSGTVDIVPRSDARYCAKASVVLFDKELREATFEGLPVDVTVTLGKKGQAARTVRVPHDGLVFTSSYLAAQVGDHDQMRLYVGDGPPEEDLLEADGADLYLKSLSALDPSIVDDIRAHPSQEAQRVLFAEVAASLKSSLPKWSPEKRIAELQRFDEKAMPPEERPLLHFWKQELGRRSERADYSVHLIIDDAVQSLWIDGVEVFNRKRGMPTGFDMKVPKEAVRAWIVTDQVHDTRAVLQGGEIYSVTSTFVQYVRGGARRECVRVVGALPGVKDIRWREISGTQTPMMGDDETYRPSGASAERAVSVVPGGDARPFPPVPLVYSYTHPGLYKWTLAKDGAVKLELIEDESVCVVKK